MGRLRLEGGATQFPSTDRYAVWKTYYDGEEGGGVHEIASPCNVS